MKAGGSLELLTRATWAGGICFLAGTVLGTAVLWGTSGPLAGAGSIGPRIAIVAAIVTAVAFAASGALHRRHETDAMPGWQRAVSHVSTTAVTLAYGAVAAMAVLLGGEVLQSGLQGLQIPSFGGGLIAGAACAVGGGAAFDAGVRVRTRDLTTLLFAFLVIGTLFSMITAADPRWWERAFSQLGTEGTGLWAFNGTVVVAGLLVAVIGAYIGRDLHRMLGDDALERIAPAVVLFALAGAALICVGVYPLHRAVVAHMIAAGATLVLFAAAAVVTLRAIPRRPAVLTVTSAALAGAVVVAAAMLWPLDVYSATGFEAVAVGLVFVWLTTLTRTLAALGAEETRPSARRSPLRRY